MANTGSAITLNNKLGVLTFKAHDGGGLCCNQCRNMTVANAFAYSNAATEGSGGALYATSAPTGSSNPIGPSSSGSTVTLTFGEVIASGGGGNDNFYVKVWTRLASNHTNVGSPTTTLLHSGPRPNGPNWWMYCGSA